MIHTSPLPDVTVPNVSITDYVLAGGDGRAERPALVDGPTGRTLTYGEFDAAVRRLAGGLVADGLQPGDTLAIMAPNLPEYAVVFHAVALAGGVVTTVNPTYTDHEVRHQLVDAGAIRLVTVGPFLDTARSATEGTKVESIHLIGEGDAPPITELFGEPLAEQVPVDLDGVVVLPYSSGTTGLSKGVMLTHRNLVANLRQCEVGPGLDDTDAFVAVLPFFHIYGMQVLMNLGLAAGSTIVTMPRFDLDQFLSLNAEHRCRVAFVAPPIVVALAKHPAVAGHDLSALAYVMSGAAPLSGETAAECGGRLGCEVVQGYGMTELSPVTHITPPGMAKPGSVGVLVPNTEMRIVDPATGTALGVGEDGEVQVRGPQVMKGYLNNPAATEATIDGDGWLHTGDVGHIDDDGHLFVVDRLKELIKYKGFQVPPAELEALLLTHPGIADAAVIGLPDEEAGEIPAGYVVAKAGTDLDAAEVQAFVAERTAHYKHLRHVEIVESIPKSASGKILRRILRDQHASG